MTINAWHVVKATGGYYFVRRDTPGKSFTFWSEEGRYEAESLVEYLNAQDNKIKQLQEKVAALETKVE